MDDIVVHEHHIGRHDHIVVEADELRVLRNFSGEEHKALAHRCKNLFSGSGSLFFFFR